jgi:putative transcription factor
MYVCDICGKESGSAYSVVVENARLIACERCSGGSNILSKMEGQKAMPRQSRKSAVESEEVIDNYGSVIRKARETMGMSLEEFGLKINEKESTLRRVEEEKMLPNETLRQKLEQFLGIRLFEKAHDERKLDLGKAGPISLWDAAYRKEGKKH